MSRIVVLPRMLVNGLHACALVGEGPLQFQVWADVCGEEPGAEPDWWWNSAPQSLSGALKESAAARAEGWRTLVAAEGCNPRPDGRWDNPVVPGAEQ